jgi:[acyl-carrier-protein] S-malonyltransferase
MTKKIALVFPGQGSQSKGMLEPFIEDYKNIVDAACQEASDVLGYNMMQLIALDPEQRLDQTAFTQPALLTAGVIAWRSKSVSNNQCF